MTIMTKSTISLNNLSYCIDDSPVRFNAINLTFENAKYGIVGSNGIGKTTLLRLLMGELKPSSGAIQCCGHLSNVPQVPMVDVGALIGDVLGVSDILHAQARIQAGSSEEADFSIMADQWDIGARIQSALEYFTLWPLDLNQPFYQLSGGQKTKILLAKTQIFPADIVLFDEPTNNLDQAARRSFYEYIRCSDKLLVIVSHDRELLRLCNKIIEIHPRGIDLYGGNYLFYQEQKAIKEKAIRQEVQAQSEALAKAKKLVQIRMERFQQNEAQGRKEKITQIKAKGSYDKIAIKAKRGRSEKTNRRIRLQADRKITVMKESLSQIRSQLTIGMELDLRLAATHIPTHKSVISIENLYFSYDEDLPLITAFNFQLVGPRRVALRGANGCGKSTLLKLICGTLLPDTGSIDQGVPAMVYLDQEVTCLNSHLSLIDNFLSRNPMARTFDAYHALAAFNFRNKDAEKRVKNLSSGERMRAALAISLMSSPVPQLIMLDEPTNHLDLASIKALEVVLQQFQGAMIAVSHDNDFLNNIGIEHLIDIGDGLL